MGLEERVVEIIAPALLDFGFDVVQVRLSGTGHQATLQIIIDQCDETQITVEDCAKASRTVSALLDVDDPIEGAYRLEVSSPGLDRPLVRRRDFERFCDFEARIELKTGLQNQKRFRGILRGIKEDDILLEIDQEIVKLDFKDLYRAKLILNDHLIAQAKDF